MIYYKKRRRYKYNLHEDYEYQAGIKVHDPSDLGYIKITSEGLLTIREKYAWDGPSGPTFDTKNFMRGSLVHDALYQLIREKKIIEDQRKRADEILREICLEDGMSKIRAWWVFWGVYLFGKAAAKPDLLGAP
jgi:Protein of unknown function (DUF1353)